MSRGTERGVARYARPAPLFYVVLLCQSAFLAHFAPDLTALLLKVLLKVLPNLTLLFGLAAPGASSLVVGGWSLGIEFVFYILFPVILITLRSRLMPASVIALVIQCAFISTVVSDQDVEADTWVAFTNPAAFAFYFMAGCYIGQLLTTRSSDSRLGARLALTLFAGAGPPGRPLLRTAGPAAAARAAAGTVDLIARRGRQS